ncbi:tyrosine-type recombinase/integrase [Pseudomonas izuensis]|uniref:tyrosine-type recombinase/integrase n=1 Tax=Pseudomonas izuensis TaxID=2684212 RepID=UPI0013591881|nr:integrase arm-type DNA-binding domain-containing protein [Pseudomonas izuensis]
MSKPNLTDLQAENASGPDGQRIKKHILTDPEIRNFTGPIGKKIKKYHVGDGLYLWCMKEGGRCWRFRYYLDGKERGMALGTYPKVSLADARKAVEKQREILKAGTDPAVEKRKAKQTDKLAKEDTFEALAKEWYDSRSHTWSSKYAADEWTRLEQHAFPNLRKLPVSQIQPLDLIAVLRKVQATGATSSAFRLLSTIRQILDFAINSGRLAHNVAIGREGALKVHKPKNRAHVSLTEFPDLVKAIATYDQIGTREVMLALQLITLVFTRANELLQAEWTEFDFDKLLWEIPASRMKMEKTLLVPLAPQVVAILKELKAMHPDSKFILPGRDGKKGLSINALLGALDSLGYGKKQTVHGFRHIASTILNEARNGDERLFDGDAVEAQLAHTSGGTRGVYNKAKYLPERRKIMGWWADYLDEIARKGAVDN